MTSLSPVQHVVSEAAEFDEAPSASAVPATGFDTFAGAVEEPTENYLGGVAEDGSRTAEILAPADTSPNVATDAPIAEASGQYLKLAVVAARLDCSVKTLKQKVLGGELDAVRLGASGHWRISERALGEFIERSRR